MEPRGRGVFAGGRVLRTVSRWWPLSYLRSLNLNWPLVPGLCGAQKRGCSLELFSGLSGVLAGGGCDLPMVLRSSLASGNPKWSPGLWAQSGVVR